MEPLKLDSKIVLNNQTYEINEVIQTLYSLPADQVVTFFNDLSLNMPRRLRMESIKNVLTDDVLKTRDERDTLADELNYRLKLFNEFSDTQYVNLLAYYNEKENNTLFMESFWLNIINYMIERGVSEEHILELFNLAKKHVDKNGIGFSDLKLYNDALNDLFYDEPDFLDGLAPKKIRPVLFQSSTLVEIREIGLKYGVDVPRRLRKKQLLEIIFDELEERDEFTEALKESLTKKSVIAIQRFAIDNEIKVSTELKKEEIIEYILENAQQTKEAYFKPETSEYHLEVDDTLLNQKVVEKKSKKKLDKTKTTVTDTKTEPVKVAREEDIMLDEQVEPVKVAREDDVLTEEQVEPTKVAREDDVLTEEQVEPAKEEQFEEPVVETQVEPTKEEPAETVAEEPVKPEKEVVKKKQPKPSPKTIDLNEALIINTIKYEDKNTFLKNYLKLDGTKKPSRSKNNDIPFELRFLRALFMFIFCVLFRIVKFVFIIATILLVIVFIYGSIVHFADISALDSINDTINGFDIFGKGILEHISELYQVLGL